MNTACGVDRSLLLVGRLVRSRDRSRTQDDAYRKSTEQWNGRSFCGHDQTRYVRLSPRPNAETVMHQLPSWITHYNEVHPHKALGYRSPREFT
jgi:transposase InsO family protein